MTIRVKSYWDWLPPEIQEYIVLLARFQHIIDRVDEAWGLGRVKIVQYKCRFQYCHKAFHMELILTYIDVYHVPRKRCLRNVDLIDLDILLMYVVEERLYLRDTDQLELDMSY